jgi:hypothetical protein
VEQAALWVEALRAAGHPTAGFRVLGGGMEGAVAALGDGLVSKLWSHRDGDHLARLREFYDALAAARPSFAAPQVLDIVPVGEGWATVEPHLPGAPLRVGMSDDEPPVSEEGVECVLEALEALAAVAPRPGLDVLPALDGEPPLAPPFSVAVSELVVRRVARFRGPLQAALPDLDRLVEAVADRLASLDSRPVGLLHGDLVPANLLVAGSGLAAVLDFGFLTGVGDPAFDAAVAASVHDMYGVHAARTESVLEEAIAERFGYQPELLDSYRAAYALITSNSFSADGSDGHFAWCVRMLQRPRVRGVLP